MATRDASSSGVRPGARAIAGSLSAAAVEARAAGCAAGEAVVVSALGATAQAPAARRRNGATYRRIIDLLPRPKWTVTVGM
jgi:hypothetical protein